MSKSWGAGHPKAIEKRQRDQTNRVNKQELKIQQKEDASWVDNNKDLERKNNRANEKEQKRLLEIERKAENRKLIQAEMAKLPEKGSKKSVNNMKNSSSTSSSSKSVNPPKKVTKAEIALKEEKEIKIRNENYNLENQNKNNSLIMLNSLDEISENINRTESERIVSENIKEARTIDQAIFVLDSKNKLDDAGSSLNNNNIEIGGTTKYKDFEESRYKLLKFENPTLKMSQIRQMIRKEWKKSALNPTNAP